MRWFVEISGLGKKPGKTATLCVEATQWQPALQRARSIRGDTGSLSAFSIELLDDGYRAIDPSARLKYVVKRAPDDATLSAGGAASDAAAESKVKNGARSKSSPPPKTSDGEKKPAASFVPTTKPSEPVKAPSPPPSQADVIEAKPLIAIPLDRPPPPPAAPGLPSYNVQSERSDDPTSRSPLYYREVVYVVGEATAASEAERLVRDRFADVRRSLASARPGKLVRLAVFDHVFSGKPRRPPVVTLTWKDWAGDEPEVRLASHEAPAPLVSTPRPAPHKIEGATTTLASASTPPEVAKVVDAPPTAAPKTVATPQPAPAPAKAEPVVEVVDRAADKPAAPAPEPVPEPVRDAAPAARVTSSDPPSAGSAKSSSPAISVREPSPSTVNRIIEIAEPPSAVEEVRISDAPAPSALPGPKTIVDAPRIDVMADEDYVPPPASFPTQSIVPPTPSYVPPAPSQPAATQPPPPPVPTVKRKKQLSADDLISELFEAMSELHFLGDALAGADYVLGVALEKIPCELGFVSLFDINKREFVVVRQRGGPRSVLGFRQPEKAPVALSAMRSKAAVIVDEAGSARAMDERYRAAGIEVRGLLCAPIALGGRYLGVIELANSEDGAFRVADANALTYVGQQLGEFVAERGVIIDAAHILETAKAAAEAQSKRRP